MNPTKMYQIEVDEEVYNFLKKNAEPFVDTTPNSVFRRFLPLKANIINERDGSRKVLPEFPAGVPNALAQTLEMIILVKKEDLNRVEATHAVADIRKISTQAVLDKYCRQLGKKAYEIDELLMNSNIHKFKKLLVEKYPYHREIIESTFTNIPA